VLVIAAVAIGVVELRKDNLRLQQRVTDLRRRYEQLTRRRDEDIRTQDLVARAQAENAEAMGELHSKLLRARAEVSELEKSAEENRTRKMARSMSEAAMLANNRDPENGLVRIENFQNLGRSTPVAAFETIIWATVNGDDNILADSLSLTDAARQKAEALIANLPEDERAEYPTPEKLAALSLASLVLNQTAFQIDAQTPVDAQNVTLSVSSVAGNKSRDVPFVSSPTGWQVVVPESAIAEIQNKLSDGPAH
jgi:hypothetical protein